jgi:MFS superfamily sulfate permease-like transporter
MEVTDPKCRGSSRLQLLGKAFPFLCWFQNYSREKFKADIIGGLTVALILVPQSMAYAQLAGLPSYYGLYAAFLPPIIASLFGSSRQLATGPVAVVSLMTATALEPLATAGTEYYIGYAILLALLVGVFQFVLGLVRLGFLVNFLSHPVVNGFTNAAAMIIATSQISSLFGIQVNKAEHHYQTVVDAVEAAFKYTHWETLLLALIAFAIMIFVKRINNRLPHILLAVVLATFISWLIGFDDNRAIRIEQINFQEVTDQIEGYNNTLSLLEDKLSQRVNLEEEHRREQISSDQVTYRYIDRNARIARCNLVIESLKKQANQYRSALRIIRLSEYTEISGSSTYILWDESLEDRIYSGSKWRLGVTDNRIEPESIKLMSGGFVVGEVPSGLPHFSMPHLEWGMVLNLFPMAMIISLLGFMEAVSVARAISSKSGQLLNPNRELIGQGLANIIGSLNQSYAVSGSFSRSAINFKAGAVTGMSNIFSSLIVLLALLLLTPLLYHLPRSVLAAVIIMAVFSLVNFKSLIHIWKAQWQDGLISVITFATTLALAPHLERGILIGVALSVILFLFRIMRPRIAVLSRYVDGSYRNQKRFELKQCPHIAVIRYRGSLFFASVPYFEKQVFEKVADMPDVKQVLIVGDGINEIDASGEEFLGSMVVRLRKSGLGVAFSGLNDVVQDTMRRTGLYDLIGEKNIFPNIFFALEDIWPRTHKGTDEEKCPLKLAPFRTIPTTDKVHDDPRFEEGP